MRLDTTTRDEALEEYASIMGETLHDVLFPAVITGVAKPQHTIRPFASCPLETPQPPCTDDPGYMDCSSADVPDAQGFYADTILPCGVWPVRYRWRSEFGSLSSEGCGWRLSPTEPSVWIPWSQRWYAVNTAHVTQDANLDYPFLPAGTLVLMQFSELAAITDDKGGPRFGFSFHHMNDPSGSIVPCPVPVPGEEIGCCIYWSGEGGGRMIAACCSQTQCTALAMEAGGIPPQYWGPPDYEPCIVDVSCVA